VCWRETFTDENSFRLNQRFSNVSSEIDKRKKNRQKKNCCSIRLINKNTKASRKKTFEVVDYSQQSLTVLVEKEKEQIQT